jgi:hypothetical protein
MMISILNQSLIVIQLEVCGTRGFTGITFEIGSALMECLLPYVVAMI